MTAARLLTAVLLSALGCVLVAGAAGLGRSAPNHRSGAAVEPVAPDRTTALAVLRDWDRARAAAWRRGEPRALRELYVEGSTSGRADRALLAAYVERGLRVDGLTMQRSAVRVRSESRGRLVLVVTDRLVGASVIGPRSPARLPRDDWSTRTVVLVRVGETWRVAEVTDQASPAASTDVTSRSANS